MNRNRIAIVALLAIAALTLPAMGQDLSFQSPISAASIDAKIGSRDVLEIKVLQDPSVNTRATVSDDGRITLGLVGKVDVGGLTTNQAELKIKTLLEAQYIKKADVSVQIVEYGSKPISVVGAVSKPGSIGISGNITLMQAITAAGGLASGYGKTLYVLRTGANGLSEQLPIDIEDLMVNGNPDLNIPLAPNDVVNVQMDTPITIYVWGEVMRPGNIQFRRSQNPTIMQAIASAGGPTDRASKTARISRTINGKTININTNYRAIANGNKPDVPLLDGDTIFLKESIF
ncbi:MAG TPA: polysaccharide biosynthesis/export family protein [Thermoanaerobaculia bacterium]|jgi:polysaccharide export outer membrane protein|nr:polysaccharide biosynthesis/export family protein [Thermoanaerobaculia bacterium]